MKDQRFLELVTIYGRAERLVKRFLEITASEGARSMLGDRRVQTVTSRNSMHAGNDPGYGDHH